MNKTEKYNKSLNEKWCMRFRTRHPDGDNYDGIITHIKRGFIALREEENFELGGLIVLPRKFIKSVRDDRYDYCCNQILRHNGAMRKFRSPRWLDTCETIPQLLSEMMRRGIWPGVEALYNQGTESAFYIGPITGVSDKGCSIWCYDAAGAWEGIYRVSLEDIFRIEFDSKYCNYFNAYMKSKTST